jgi:hypothetical protein
MPNKAKVGRGGTYSKPKGRVKTGPPRDRRLRGNNGRANKSSRSA